LRQTSYPALYQKINRVMKEYTPLHVDCGQLCDRACCKGDEDTGMRLFPHEETTLSVRNLANGVRLAVCDGSCSRENRPLACRIFPFFPTIDERGKIFVEADDRAVRLCPMLSHIDELDFDPKFFKAVKKVGKLLAKDEECRVFLQETTKEIDLYRTLLGK